MAVSQLTLTRDSSNAGKYTLSPSNYADGIYSNGKIKYVSNHSDYTVYAVLLYDENKNIYTSYMLNSGSTVSLSTAFQISRSLDGMYLEFGANELIPIVKSPTLNINTFSAAQQNDGTVKFSCKATGANGSGSVTYTIKYGSTTLYSFTGSSGSTVTQTTTIASSLKYGSSCSFTLTATYSGVSATKTISKTFVTPSISTPTLSLTGTTFSWTAASFSSYLTGTKTYYLYKDGENFHSTTGTSYTLPDETISDWGSGSYTITVKAVGTSLSNKSYTSVMSNASNSVTYEISACTAPSTITLSATTSYIPVKLEWSGEECGTANAIVGYDIQYQDSEDGVSWPDNWIDVKTNYPASPLEVSPPDAVGHYRRFGIRVRGSAGEDYYSDWVVSSVILRKGMAPFEGFTDPELVQLGTKIKAVHMTEMQNRINNLLLFNGKEAYSFTSIEAGKTRLSGWTSHVTEIRNATDALKPSHEDWLEITENRPRVDVMTQLRDVIIGYSKVTISVDGENGLPEGCVVTVVNTTDGSTIAEFEYTEQKMIRISPGMTYRVKCSASADYKVSPISKELVAEENSFITIELMYRNAVRYGFKREKANSDPAARITYIYDAEGMEPMTVNLTTGTPNYGNWGTFIDEVCRPVMLKTNGTVDYELDHNDQTLKLDGTSSDISNTAYDGNAMVEFREYKWVHRSEDENYEYVVFSNVQYDDTYQAYAHTNASGDIQDVFYWGMYKGTLVGSKLRSCASNATPENTHTTTVQIGYAEANGTGYYISYKSGRDYINDLITLVTKNDDSEVCGSGRASGTNTMLGVGSTVSKKSFYGLNTNTADVKTFYVEGHWGNIAERTAGLIYKHSAGGFLVQMTPPYNTTGSGYNSTGITVSADGFIKNSSNTMLHGWLPASSDGAQGTYIPDAIYRHSSNVGYARYGGSDATTKYHCGSRCVIVSQDHTHSTVYGNARLTYIPPTISE